MHILSPQNSHKALGKQKQTTKICRRQRRARVAKEPKRWSGMTARKIKFTLNLKTQNKCPEHKLQERNFKVHLKGQEWFKGAGTILNNRYDLSE